MSGILFSQAIRVSVNLSPTERLVMYAIANDLSDSTCSGTPSIDYLAGACRVSVRTVQRTIGKLVELGLLKRHVGAGRAVGPKRHRTNLYEWDYRLAARLQVSREDVVRLGMATRTQAEQRRRYGRLVSEMGDEEVEAGSREFAGVEAPEPEPEPEPEPQAPAVGKGFPSHPEWRRYAAAFKALGKDLTRFSAQAWLRFVQQDGTSPKAIDARAALAADCAEQYVKDLRHERRGFAVAKGYAKSAENFLAEGVWEAHRPRPEVPQPEPGEAMEDRCGGESAPEVPFEERYPEYARAAAGDEAAVEMLRRVLPSRFFEAPAGVPARWPGLIGVLGLRESFSATAEDRAAFAQAAGAGCEGVPESPQGPEEPSGEVPEPVCEEESQAVGEPLAGRGVSWEVAPVGEPSKEYAEACARPWEPRFEPPAPPPAASPDAPVVDDEWGIGAAERAALAAPYSAVGSAEEFREQALLASQGTLGDWG